MSMTDQLPVISTVLVALITAVIGPTVIEIVKRKLGKKESEDSLVKEMEIDNQINEQIEILLGDLDCDRVWVTQFHNGGHFYSSGVSIKKFSIFYEKTAPGVSLIQQQFQNVPASFFSKSLKYIHENDELEVIDMNDQNSHAYGLRDTAQSTGCQSVFLVCLKTPSGKFHGMLGVESVKDVREFTEEEKETVRAAASYISGTLSFIHKSK